MIEYRVLCPDGDYDPGLIHATVEDAETEAKEAEFTCCPGTHTIQQRVDGGQWADVESKLELARTALRLAKSMILSGESMTPEAERVINRGLAEVSTEGDE